MSRRTQKHKNWLATQPSSLASYLELLTQLTLCFQIVSTALYYNTWIHPLDHKIFLAQVLAACAWLFFGLYSIASKRLILRHSPYYLPAFVLALWAGIRAFTAAPEDALQNYWIFLSILSGFPLWVTVFRSRRARSLFLWTVLFTGGCMAIGCLRQLSTSSPEFSWSFFKAITLSSGDYERQCLGSFMGHNNDSTEFLALSAIFAGLLWTRYRRKFWSYVFGAYILLALVLIYLGGSRGVVLALAASCFFLLSVWFMKWIGAHRVAQITQIFTNRRFQTAIGVMAVAAILLGVFLSAAPIKEKKVEGVLARFLSPPEYLVSGTYPRVWLMSLLMAREHPLTGVGFSAWPYYYPDYQKRWFGEYPTTRIGLPEIGRHSLQAHNDYLQLWAELGLPGLVCMLWLFWVHGCTIRAIVRRDELSLMGWFAVAATLLFLTRALFAFPFHMAAASCIFLASLALVSSQVCEREWTWKPDWLIQRTGKSRWALAGGVFLFFVAFSAHNWRMIVVDYATRSCEIWRGYASDYAQKDPTNYQACLQKAYDDIQHSLQLWPPQGKALHELGATLTVSGVSLRDEKMLEQALNYLHDAQKSYSFYRIHEYLGLANRALWEITQKPEYLKDALAEFREAVAIMPTYAAGWVEQALLLAKSGQVNECLDLLSNTELRFPGIVENDMLAMARTEPDIKNRVILYDLASSIVPGSEKIFNETLIFYTSIARLDRAVNLFIQMAQYQKPKVMVNWLTTLLLTQLENRMLSDAVGMMRDLRRQPALQAVREISYYSGLIHWLAGQAEVTESDWANARRQGIPFSQIEPPLSTVLAHGFLPLNLR